MPIDAIIARVRGALMLDATAYEEARDDNAFTPYAAVLAAIAVVLAAIGAWLFGEVVLDQYKPDGWFVDTVLLGTIFTAVLMAVGIGVMYVVLTQALRESIPTIDGFARVALLGHLAYAVSLFVFIPELGFTFAILSMAWVFFDTVFGIRSAYPTVTPLNAVIAVSAGIAVWAILLTLISEAPNNNWVTGPFVYSLFE